VSIYISIFKVELGFNRIYQQHYIRRVCPKNYKKLVQREPVEAWFPMYYFNIICVHKHLKFDLELGFNRIYQQYYIRRVFLKNYIIISTVGTIGNLVPNVLF